MKDQDDFLSPEEVQAKANQKKISSFIGKMGWQFVILTTVVYAVIFNNEAAGWLLDGYSFLLAFACVMFIGTTIKPLAQLAVKVGPEHALTPSRKVTLGIGTLFSCIEIFILSTHGMISLAVLWMATELFQYAAIYREQVALHHPGNPGQMMKRHFADNPEIAEKYYADMDAFAAEVTKIDELILDLKLDDDYPEALTALMDERGKILAKAEALVDRTATETYQNQKQDD